MSDLPETLPIFPLTGAILLPRSRLPLHIFEPRYLAMVGDALKTDHRLIGMIQPMSQAGGGDGLHGVGCAGRITSFSETDDGRYMITLTGISRYRIAAEVEGFQPYRRARMDWGFPAEMRTETDPAMDRAALLSDLARYFKQRHLGVDWEALKAAEDEMMVNALSMLCPFAPEEKQALLEAPDLPARRQVLQTLIAFALQSGGEDEVLQ